MAKLKQPLRLADNISAFDPQTPLNLSPDISSHISIPIADKSAVAGERVGRGTLVHGVARHDQTFLRFDPDFLITISHEFTSAADFYNFEPITWSHTFLIRATWTGGPFTIHWYHGISGSDLLMSFPATEIQLVRFRDRKQRISCTGFPGTIKVTIVWFINT